MFRDDPPALELRGLTKRYDDGTLALEDFDLEIHSGAFFGLLGPNGAGKTTLISAVCNLLRVTEGEVLVFGEPHDTLEARSWVGLAEQDINLDRFLTVRETLDYHGGYFGMDKDEIEERAEEMIEAFGLTSKRDVRAPKLSGGQRRRLLLARALMHRPRLVILDEPTAGVDFELRQELWALHPPAARRGHHDPAHHALPRGGRAALRGDRPDPRRAPDRARHAPTGCASTSASTGSRTST